MAKTAKVKRKIDLPEAVKRADKALKRETGTPPKPYRPASEKTAAPAPRDGIGTGGKRGGAKPSPRRNIGK